MLELLGGNPSVGKAQTLLEVFSFRFDFTHSLESELQRFLDCRSTALLCLGSSLHFGGDHPA